MTNNKKLLLIPFILVLLILSISLFGCGSTEGTTQQVTTPTTSSTIAVTTSPEIISTIASPSTTTLSLGQKIAAQTIEAAVVVTTFKMDMDMTMAMGVIGGEDPGKMNMETIAKAEMNLAEKEVKMAMDAEMDIPVIGKQTMSSSFYMVGGWMYMKVSIPKQGEQWIKIKYDEAQWEQQDQFSQQIEFLRSALGATLLGTETVDGVLCDVIQIQPDMATLAEWVMAQQSEESAAELSQVDLSNMFKTFLIKYWIAKDTSLPVKADMNMTLEINQSDFGTSSNEFEKMTMEITATVKYYDYGKPVDTTLPVEAEGAKEVATN